MMRRRVMHATFLDRHRLDGGAAMKVVVGRGGTGGTRARSDSESARGGAWRSWQRRALCGGRVAPAVTVFAGDKREEPSWYA